ncbi:MAG: SDR family NAD(P)-dependent oxidoreductase [Promethearchaeota archaeon]
MKKNNEKFLLKYGSWALIAGGSDGIGEEFAKSLAQRGLNIVLLARRLEVLQNLQGQITNDYQVKVRIIQQDLAATDILTNIRNEIQDLDIGFLVYNACYCPTGPYLSTTFDNLEKAIRVNVLGINTLVYYFAGLMKQRKKGGIVLVGSQGGLSGMPFIGQYSATKSYATNLAEALWYELKPFGIDVMCSLAGATSTPAFLNDDITDREGLPQIQTPFEYVEETLKEIGKNPSYITGRKNRFVMWLLHRVMKRKTTVIQMGKANEKIYGEK